MLFVWYFFPLKDTKYVCIYMGMKTKQKKQISCVTLLKFCALLSVRVLVLRCSYKQLFRTRPSDRARTEWTAKDAGRSVRTETKSKGTFTTHWHDDGFFFFKCIQRERRRRKRALVQSTESGQLDTQRESDCSKPMKKK